MKRIKAILPKRFKTANKTNGGRTLIIAGSQGLLGAGILASRAASRVGSGYVILMTDLQKFSSLKNPDFLTADYKKQKISSQKFSAVAIGPGLGQNQKTKKLLQELLKINPKNVVVDADALNILSKQKNIRLPPTWVVTPHEGELARLLKIDSLQIQKHRKKFALLAAQKLGCIVLLKGHNTLIAQNKKIIEIKTGNVALAKAGTGDVLTGMIAGFLAQGVQPMKAVQLAANLHGKIADEWVKKKDYLSLTPNDLIEKIPEAIFKMRTSAP